MKPAYLLYALAISLLLLADIYLNVYPGSAAVDETEITVFREKFSRAIDTRGDVMTTRKFHETNAAFIYVSPGFVLIHDARLRDSVTVTGPAGAMAHLVKSDRPDELSFDFNRAVRLEEPVEIRANLSLLHPYSLSITLRPTAAGRTRFPADLVTPTALRIPALTLATVPAHPIAVEVDELTLKDTRNLHQLRGKASKVTVRKPAAQPDDEIYLDGLEYGEQVVIQQ